MKKILVFAIIMSIAVDVCAQQTRKLTPDKFSDYGLVYTLPNTAIEIEIKANATVRKAGPYYAYAQKYLGTDKVITADSEQWSIESVRMRTYGVANDSSAYRMQLKSGALTYITVADDGMILSINKEMTQPQQEEWSSYADSFTPLTGKEYLEYVGEDFLAAQSSSKRAEILAQNIMEVRDAKISLTRGTAETMPTDGKQLELMLNSLRHQEEVMTAAFCGSEQTKSAVIRLTYMPDEEGKYILTRFSDFAGFVDSEDLSGAPVYVDVNILRKGEIPRDEKGLERKFPKDGVAYCLPGEANIAITYKGSTLISKDFQFAQYGVVYGLDPTLFTSKKAPSFAIFNPTTGAISELGEIKE